jgi:putative membrane protein
MSIVTALVTTALAVSALAQGTPATSANASVSADDRKFMEEAAIGGQAEVQLGSLAQQKAVAPQVKQFGSRMTTDHSKANEELKSLAASKGVTLPNALDKKHQKDLDDLSKTTKFDHEYMEMMVQDHKKDVAEFKKRSTAAKDPDLRAWATKTLPTLEQHLKLAEETQKAVKSAAK